MYNKHVNFKVALVQLDYDFYNTLSDLIELETPMETLNQVEWDISTVLHPQGVTDACCNDFMANTTECNGDNLYSLLNLGIQNYVLFNVYCDSVLVFTKRVYNNKSFKLPRGFKSKHWEFEVKGMIPVKRIAVATSTEEIKQ